MESGLMDSFSITITSCFFFALPPAKKNFGLPARVISAQAHPVPARDRRPPGEGRRTDASDRPPSGDAR